MKILFVYKAEGAPTRDNPFLAALPVGLGTMAALLRAEGHFARVANLSADRWAGVERFLASEQADIVAISVFTHNRGAAERLAGIAKGVRRDGWVICGGPHATHAPDQVLAWPGVDGVVLGEGEETVLDLVRFRGSNPTAPMPPIRGMALYGRPPSGVRPPLKDLDLLPFAHNGYKGGYGIDVRAQSEFIITSRGCPASCHFCSSPGFWGRGVRYRSAGSVVEELKAIRHDLGLLYFSIRDDTFTSDRRRVMEICRRIIEERLHILWNCQSRVTALDGEVLGWMKRAGCECVQLGIESGSAGVLKYLGKSISTSRIGEAVAAARQVGLQVSVYLIAGVPGETPEDLDATEALLRSILPHDGQVSPLVYYPGTPLFARAVAEGRVPPDYFAVNPGPALQVRTDPFTAKATKRLLACLESVGRKAAYRKADFLAHKRLLGYCHGTNLQAGDTYARHGQRDAAEKEYREITRREPENPWGWLSLGELELAEGRWKEARQCFERVHGLVPAHLPAILALAEVSIASGDRRGGLGWLDLAEGIAPGDEGVLACRRELQ